eukprot:7843212-Pyramimonas_sp.AAC.1
MKRCQPRNVPMHGNRGQKPLQKPFTVEEVLGENCTSGTHCIAELSMHQHCRQAVAACCEDFCRSKSPKRRATNEVIFAWMLRGLLPWQKTIRTKVTSNSGAKF